MKKISVNGNHKILRLNDFVIMFMFFCISACTGSDKLSDKEYNRLQIQYDSLLPKWIAQFENDIISFEKQDSQIGRAHV